MKLGDNVKKLCFKFHTGIKLRRTKGRRTRSIQISPPFNFKHETPALPEIPLDEIIMLKEKAAASSTDIADRTETSPIAPHPISNPLDTPVVKVMPLVLSHRPNLQTL